MKKQPSEGQRGERNERLIAIIETYRERGVV
jgi:hypothetical protein